MTDKPTPAATPKKGPARTRRPSPPPPRPVPPASLIALVGSARDPRNLANKRAHAGSPTLAGMTGIRAPKPTRKPDDEGPAAA